MPVSPSFSGSILSGNGGTSSGDSRQDQILRFLGHHFDPLSQTLARFFDRRFQLELSIELLGIERGLARDLPRRQQRSSHFVYCPTDDQKVLFFLGVNPILSGILLDRLEGGRDETPSDPMIRPTLFDQTLLSAFCERLAPLISAYIGDQLSLAKPRTVDFETVCASVDSYFILTWSVSVQKESGYLELYLPTSRVTELIHTEDFQSEKENPLLRILAGRISRQILPREMSPGTVISTGLKPDALFHAVLGKDVLFKVRIGEYHGEEAVEVVEDISKI